MIPPQNPGQEIKEQKSTHELKVALTDLAANLIRIVRGAGAPDRILEQIRGFAEAYAAYVSAHGREAHPGLFNQLLFLKNPELPENDDYADILLFDHAICRTALQVVASSLLDQRLQLDGAMAELHRHLHGREEERRRRATRRKKGRPSKDPPIVL